MKHAKLIVMLMVVLVLTLGLTACININNNNNQNNQPPFATVTFVYGASTDKTTTTAVYAGEKVSVPTDLIPEEGKVIVAWYKDRTCSDGQKWNFDTDIVTANITLYAKLVEIEPVTVTLVYGSESEKTIETEFNIGEKVNIPNNEIEIELGAVILGWYKDEACSDGQEWNLDADIVTEDITLYAKWGECEITIAEALEFIETLEPSVSAPKTYLIRGTITEIKNASFGQVTLTDDTGSIMVYGLYNEDGSLRYDKLEDKPVVGDEVLLKSELQYYKGTTHEIIKGYILEIKHEEKIELNYEELYDTEISIKKALEIGEYISDGETTTGRFIIKATVKSIVNSNYGSMVITDGTDEISVYGSYSADGVKRYPDLEDKPYAGDEVTLSVNLKNFKGSAEINSAWILEFKHTEIEIDENDYTLMSINEAREAELGTKVRVSGVVARITFANGKIPSGFYLVDNTNSIYVYDSQITARVSIGNTITILAQKAYWILETEQANAQKFGYKGCNQLEKAVLIENDNLTSDFDKSWITESTVKEVINTPIKTDITSTIFKVNALIKRVDGQGFINYYFDDLDGKTGSYAYTQCNGSDFDWLDVYDGKICTVYLSALNAKSTASGCGWRFIPVEVVDEGYVFDLNNASEYAVIYHALDQFLSSYKADPEIEVVTSVSSELLGFEGVEITYVSSNSDVIYFENNVMHTKNTGTAVVTITASLSGYQSYSQEITITVVEAVEIPSISVAEAISAKLGTEITVRGIVGPSFVNQIGFYLVSDEGILAVRTTKAQMEDIHLGNEVIVKGTRVQVLKAGYTGAGQACIDNSMILNNYYGNNEYSTASFDTTKTLADLKEISVDEDYTTQAFIVRGKFVKSQYKWSIEDDKGNSFDLYAGGVGQYSWLSDFGDEVVTVEFILCNWNSKTYYAGCVLAVILEDGTKVVNQFNLAQ